MSLASTDPLATSTAPESVKGERRRLAARDVRQARDRLTFPTGGESTFDYELLRQYAQNRLSGALGMILLAAAVGLVSAYRASAGWAGLWMAMVLTILLASMVKCREVLGEPPSETGVKRARRTFIALDLLFGVAWAIALAHPTEDPSSFDIVNLFAMLLVLAMSSMLGAALPVAALATTAPLTLAVAVAYFFAGSVHGQLLAGLALTALCYFGLLTNRLYTSVRANLGARAEKDAVIDALGRAATKSDAARRHAEAANLAKSRFLAQMSHELRTPLNVILGFSEVMKNELFGAHPVPPYKDYANDIHNSAVQLLGLINDVLDLSRIEAGSYELEEEPVLLVEVAEECRHLLRLRTSHRGLTVHDAFEPDMPGVWAERRAVRQICLNLLSNAIKFTPEGGEVWLKVGWTAAGGQYFSVRDNGPGIPESDIPVVLEGFGKGANAAQSTEQGAGLGLPLAKSLVELHGGTFSLRSKVREGTEVVVTFPPERVMALEAMADAPHILDQSPADRHRSRARLPPSMQNGRGLLAATKDDRT